MGSSAIAIPSGAGSVTSHEGTYYHEEKYKRLFDASVLLDLSANVPSVGGLVPNIGLAPWLEFCTVGSWSKVALGNGYYWTNSGAAAIRVKPSYSNQYASKYNASGSSQYAAGTVVTTTGHNATFGITDPNNNLQDLFGMTLGTSIPRAYKIDIQCTTSGTIYRYSGFIGSVAKSGNDYTLNVHTWAFFGTQDFSGLVAGTSWSNNSVYYTIYPCDIDLTGSSTGTLSNGGFCLWYAPGTTNTASAMIMGKKSNSAQSSYNTDLAISHHSSTAASIILWNQAVAGLAVGNVLPSTPIWNHFGYMRDGSFVRLFVNGKCISSVAIGGSATLSWGFPGIGWDSKTGEELVSGSYIAYPRWWTEAPSPAVFPTIYRQELTIFGLNRNR